MLVEVVIHPYLSSDLSLIRTPFSVCQPLNLAFSTVLFFVKVSFFFAILVAIRVLTGGWGRVCISYNDHTNNNTSPPLDLE